MILRDRTNGPYPRRSHPDDVARIDLDVLSYLRAVVSGESRNNGKNCQGWERAAKYNASIRSVASMIKNYYYII